MDLLGVNPFKYPQHYPEKIPKGLNFLYFPLMKSLCLALLFFPGIGFSQIIEKYYDYQWQETEPKYARFYSQIEKTDSGWHRKDYFVQGLSLQMDGWYEDSLFNMPSGPFIYLYPNKNVQLYGRYIHNKKQGLWLSLYPDGRLADSTVYIDGKPIGTSIGWHHNGMIADSSVYRPDGSGVQISWFNNGNPSFAGFLAPGFKQHGTWKYFHKNGNVSSIETYDQGVLVKKQFFDETGRKIDDTTNSVRQAGFPGGPEAWVKYISKHLYFPSQYEISNSDKAVVVISLSIDEDGKVQDAYISTPFHPQIDKIALESVRRSPNWIPAMDHNRTVRSDIRQPVVFSQQE